MFLWLETWYSQLFGKFRTIKISDFANHAASDFAGFDHGPNQVVFSDGARARTSCGELLKPVMWQLFQK